MIKAIVAIRRRILGDFCVGQVLNDGVSIGALLIELLFELLEDMTLTDGVALLEVGQSERALIRRLVVGEDFLRLGNEVSPAVVGPGLLPGTGVPVARGAGLSAFLLAFLAKRFLALFFTVGGVARVSSMLSALHERNNLGSGTSFQLIVE